MSISLEVDIDALLNVNNLLTTNNFIHSESTVGLRGPRTADRRR